MRPEGVGVFDALDVRRRRRLFGSRSDRGNLGRDGQGRLGWMAGRLVMLCGLPGSGKTTLALRMTEARGAVRLCEDEWLTDLGIDLFDEGARTRLERCFWELTQQLLTLGQTVILESGFWTKAERDEKRHTARSLGAPVELHFLDVPVDELWRRIDRRNASWAVVIERADLDGWIPRFEPPDATEAALFDPPPEP